MKNPCFFLAAAAACAKCTLPKLPLLMQSVMSSPAAAAAAVAVEAPSLATDPPAPVPIKHLVICGGGIIAFPSYAALRDSSKQGFWNIDQIASIDGTSSGALVATMLALKYDWSTLDEYLIARPWNKVFTTDLLSAFQERGIFKQSQFEEVLRPLILGKELDPEITLLEFHKWSGIDLHFYACNLNDGPAVDVDFSHKTHPDWRLLDAVYSSCCFPGLFQPFLAADGGCYMDGGVLYNYPINPCLARLGDDVDPRAIFGIRRDVSEHLARMRVDKNTGLMETVMTFIHKNAEKVSADDVRIPNELLIPFSPMNLPDLYGVIQTAEERARLLDKGSEAWKYFCEWRVRAATTGGPL